MNVELRDEARDDLVGTDFIRSNRNLQARNAGDDLARRDWAGGGVAQSIRLNTAEGIGKQSLNPVLKCVGVLLRPNLFGRGHRRSSDAKMKSRHILLLSALAIAVGIGTFLWLLPRNSPTANIDAFAPSISENRGAELTVEEIIVANSATILPGQLCEVGCNAGQWELRLDLLHAGELVASVHWQIARNGDKAVRIDNPPVRPAGCVVYENGALMDSHEIHAIGPNLITVTANLQFDHISREHFDYQAKFEATLNERGVVDAGNDNTLHWTLNAVRDL